MMCTICRRSSLDSYPNLFLSEFVSFCLCLALSFSLLISLLFLSLLWFSLLVRLSSGFSTKTIIADQFPEPLFTEELGLDGQIIPKHL
jgi:hypothetical protein